MNKNNKGDNSMKKLQPKNKDELMVLIIKAIHNIKENKGNYDANLNHIDVSLVEDFSELFSKRVSFYVDVEREEVILIDNTEKSKAKIRERLQYSNRSIDSYRAINLRFFGGDFSEWQFTSAKTLANFLASNERFNTHDLVLDLPQCEDITGLLYSNTNFNKKLIIRGKDIKCATGLLEKSVFNNQLTLNLPNLEDGSNMFKASHFNAHALHLKFPKLKIACNMFSWAKFNQKLVLDAPLLEDVSNMFSNNFYFNQPLHFNSFNLKHCACMFKNCVIASQITFEDENLLKKIGVPVSMFNNAINLENKHIAHNKFLKVKHFDIKFLSMFTGSKVMLSKLKLPYFESLIEKAIEKIELSKTTLDKTEVEKTEFGRTGEQGSEKGIDYKSDGCKEGNCKEKESEKKDSKNNVKNEREESKSEKECNDIDFYTLYNSLDQNKCFQDRAKDFFEKLSELDDFPENHEYENTDEGMVLNPFFKAFDYLIDFGVVSRMTGNGPIYDLVSDEQISSVIFSSTKNYLNQFNQLFEDERLFRLFIENNKGNFNIENQPQDTFSYKSEGQIFYVDPDITSIIKNKDEEYVNTETYFDKLMEELFYLKAFAQHDDGYENEVEGFAGFSLYMERNHLTGKEKDKIQQFFKHSTLLKHLQEKVCELSLTQSQKEKYGEIFTLYNIVMDKAVLKQNRILV